MKAVESSAQTREEAIEKALAELGVEMYEVDKIEILDEGSKGILGFGKRDVRVKVIVENLHDEQPKSKRPAKRVDRDRSAEREKRREGRGGNREQGRRRDRDDRKKREDRGDRKERGERKERGDRKERGERKDLSERNEREERSVRKPNRDRKRNDENGRRDRSERDERSERGERSVRKPNRERPRREEVSSEGQAQDKAERTVRRDRVRENRREDAGTEREDRSIQRSSLEKVKGGEKPTSSAPKSRSRLEKIEPVAKADAPVEAEATAAPQEENNVQEEQPRRERAPREERERRPRRDRDETPLEPITEEQGQNAAAILQEIIQKMGMEATVEFARADDETARLNVESEDQAILIGRKGRTLSSLQYIINRVAFAHDAGDSTERLVVDVGGYIDRRRESLEDMAHNMADKAKSTGRNMRLKPMTPQERRIIHMALADDEEIRTFSLGDSLYRSVVISPRDGDNGGRGRGRGRGRRTAGANAGNRYDEDDNAGAYGD